MSISKFSAAIGSIANENTLAFLKLNFDFALYKYEAPQEFMGLGVSLNDRRREAAESGTPHRIARKLGALFDQVAPSAPELVSAYGLRVSEIAQMQGLNAKEKTRDGPFRDHMGVDGTAIWAAATSGTSAIPILMLGCMLARIWEASEATSLWAEIVAQRQEEIRGCCRGTSGADFAALQAMQQEFPRAQLADWDASIRAWLLTADEARKRDQAQLMLIVKNINLPVSNKTSVYKSVLESWRLAMIGMNNLVQGIPQGVQNGALLLGLSAWHLYPDMVVHGTRDIRYKDLLIKDGGILTVGLQNSEGHDEGVYWSLPLAHLRYYGDPVLKSRSISEDNSRVSMEQLSKVALGAVFSGWSEQPSEIRTMASWFSDLSDFLCRVASKNKSLSHDSPNTTERASWVARNMLKQSGWLELLMSASKSLLAMEGAEWETSLRLVAFGMRRGKLFLDLSKGHPKPFFGLSNPRIILPMLVDAEERIRVLRSVASNLDLDQNSLIIRYKRTDSITGDSWYEYASAAPCTTTSRKRSSIGTPTPTRRHKRWIAMETDGEDLTTRTRSDEQYACQCKNNCIRSDDKELNCPCSTHYDGCSEYCSCSSSNGGCVPVLKSEKTGRRKRLGQENSHGQLKQKKCFINESLLLRKEAAEDRGLQYTKHEEVCTVQDFSSFVKAIQPYDKEIMRLREEADLWVGRQRREVTLDTFLNTWERGHHFTTGQNGEKELLISPIVVALADAPWDCDGFSPRELSFLLGNKDAAIFRVHLRGENVIGTNSLYLQDFPQIFARDALDVDKLDYHFRNLAEAEDFMDYSLSLTALASAANVYKLLPDATIDLRVTNRPLHRSRWVQKQGLSVDEKQPRSRLCQYSAPLSRPMTFACIANFESGTFDIDPEYLREVMAMSTGNSLFIAAPLLCDPNELPAEHEIQRVVGNIGRAGMGFLIPPQETRILNLEANTWNVVTHAAYDGEPENSFQSTSMHLSFTPYTQPIKLGDHGLQDTEAFLVESLVAVHDRDRWIAHVDILKTLGSPLFARHFKGECKHKIDAESFKDLVAVDNWEELLDKDDISGVFRAQGNWLARLAAAAISVRKGYQTIILPDSFCWECVKPWGFTAATFIA